MKKHGFTLAEVLVTLGIIGVVSAMTIPALTQNWQKRAYVTQLHKVYNELQQAFMQTVNNKNALNLEESGFTDGSDSNLKNFLHDNFKITKDCGHNYSQCFASSYRSIDGRTLGQSLMSACYSVVTASGAAVAINVYSSGDGDSADAIGYVYVDTNGQKGPNIGGRDYFIMYIYPDSELDDIDVSTSCRKSSGCAKEIREEMYDRYCRSTGAPDGCFGKLLNDNWEMNY